MVDQIEALVGIEVGDLNLRHQAVLNMLHQHYHDPPHAMQTANRISVLRRGRWCHE
jgi:hypothetical protein